MKHLLTVIAVAGAGILLAGLSAGDGRRSHSAPEGHPPLPEWHPPLQDAPRACPRGRAGQGRMPDSDVSGAAVAPPIIST